MSQSKTTKKHLYPHATEVTPPPPQINNKTFARTKELTSKHVPVLMARSPSHTLLQMKNKFLYKANSLMTEFGKRLKNLI